MILLHNLKIKNYYKNIFYNYKIYHFNIPIESRLLKPIGSCKIIYTMDGHNLSSFMFTVPRQFQAHESLFKMLGTKRIV